MYISAPTSAKVSWVMLSRGHTVNRQKIVLGFEFPQGSDKTVDEAHFRYSRIWPRLQQVHCWRRQGYQGKGKGQRGDEDYCDCRIVLCIGLILRLAGCPSLGDSAFEVWRSTSAERVRAPKKLYLWDLLSQWKSLRNRVCIMGARVMRVASIAASRSSLVFPKA